MTSPSREDAVRAVAEALYPFEMACSSENECHQECAEAARGRSVEPATAAVAALVAAGWGDLAAERAEVERLRHLCDDDLRRHRVGRAVVDALTVERDRARATLAEVEALLDSWGGPPEVQPLRDAIRAALRGDQ